MKKRILLIVAVIFSVSASAQKNVKLAIKHMMGSAPFALNQATTNNLNNNLEFTRADYYISKITLIHDGAIETTVPNKYILARAKNGNVLEGLGMFNVTNIEGIKFHVGVDSPVNTSDPSLWTLPHPLALDTPSMHWGWASGYRFAAIEGKSGATLNQNFQFHSLWDEFYFEQTIMVAGVNDGNDVTINLDADFEEALRDIDVSAGGNFHGAKTKDADVLRNFRDHVFSAGSGLPAAVSNIEKEIGLKIFPNPTQGNLQITLDNTGKTVITTAAILDATGRSVNNVSFNSHNAIDVQFDAKGIYFVQLYSFGIPVTTKRIIVQ